MAVTTLIEPLVGLWKRRVGGAVGHTVFALGVAGLFGAAHLARLGTAAARLGAVAILAGLLALVVIRALRERRTWRDARRILVRVLSPTDSDLAGRALRAYSLVEQAEAGTLESSSALASLHLRRVLACARPEAVESSARKRARWWRWATLGFAVAAIGGFAVGPMRVVEGLDVLLARQRVAPLPLIWLDYPQVTTHPPAYLGSPEHILLLGVSNELPKGSRITFVGTPRRTGRDLVLTDGKTEVAFVSDGAGRMVARWSVETDAELRVAARFGDVVVHEPEGIAFEAVLDDVPQVVLEGAPREVSLERTSRLELQYVARDDHGLRQVDVVLRAGNREDRRVLVRLNGDNRIERGGHALTASDPFLRRMFLPTLVTVEARDNDPLDGPKWGRSEAITLVPPPLGKPEAERLAGLRKARDALVDLLAWQLKGEKKSEEEQRRVAGAVKSLETAVDPSAALPVADGLRAFLRGQAGVLSRPPKPGASKVRRTEDVLLAVDVAIERLAVRDARSVSLRLADVADEVASGVREARESEVGKGGRVRLEAALSALRAGTKQLLELGTLGRDIGSVAQGDTDRIERALSDNDLLHAELAAKHLAGRLRRPNPSFGSKRTGGVESGGSVAMDAGEASQADQRFDELARELEQLTLQHASEIGTVERALDGAEQQAKLEDLREEARRRAQELQRAIADLPQPGAEPGSARSSAAIGREHAGAMSQSLEQLSLEEAVESGERALSSLDDAQRRAQVNQHGFSDWLSPGSVDRARAGLKEHLAWAKEHLQRAQRQVEESARDALEESGKREHQHAQRAGNLWSRGRNSQTALPEQALQNLERAESLMNEAAQELKKGRGRRALELQREAQRLLEQANQGRTTDESSRPPPKNNGQQSGQRGMRREGDVPEESSDQARDFRQRVVEGLGGERRGVFAPAVRRYAEGLLR